MYLARFKSFRGIKFHLALLLGLFMMMAAQAQEVITHNEQQLIKEVATERVKVFTKYFSLLAKEKDDKKKQAYIQYINLSFVEQKPPVRVYNDLLPASLVEQNPILDQYLSLEDYLKQTSENYTNSLHLAFDDHQFRNIYYSDFLKQHFAVISVTREISGMYRNGVRLVESKSSNRVDYFVLLQINNKELNVGGIFGFEPQQERPNYREVKVLNHQSMALAEDRSIFRETLKVAGTGKKIRIKRGRHYELRWTGGLKDDIIEVELLPANSEHRGDTICFEPLRNQKSTRVLIDQDVETGLYRFRIKNITTGRYTQTGYVRIKKKFILFGYVAPASAIPADAALCPVSKSKRFYTTSISYHS